MTDPILNEGGTMTGPLTTKYSRTWLIAVMQGNECLAAETVVGSAHVIYRLCEICDIIVQNTISLVGFEVIIVRHNNRSVLNEKEIKSFAKAFAQKGTDHA